MISIQDYHLSGKRVLVRCDFDVPIKDGVILDDFRIQQTLSTLKYLLNLNSTLILLAHYGRPETKDESFSLFPVVEKLSHLLNKKVTFVKEYELAKEEKGIILLENLRFVKGEMENDSSFAQTLASLGEVYVNEAFAESHREVASIVGVAQLLPSFAGLNLVKEINALSKVLYSPKHPHLTILGGAKIETKLPVIKNLVKVSDNILVGGKLLKEKIPGEHSIILPQDVLIAKVLDEQIVGDVLVEKTEFAKKLENFRIFDIGPEATKDFIELIEEAKMVVWNGPLGLFEDERFAQGTKMIARAIANSNAFSVVGGGDSVLALKNLGLMERVDHVSTGGGAMLKFLAGEKLPGIGALK